MNEYKPLKNIDLSGIETKRIRATGYKSDHNTPCKHFFDACPLDLVLSDEAYKGLYIALKEKAYQDGGNDYNGGYYMTFNDIGDNVYIEFLGFMGNEDIERMREKLNSMQAYIGRSGFLSYCAALSARGWFVKNPELMTLDMIGEVELVKKYRIEKAAIIEKKEQEDRERREQYRKEQEEKQRRIEEEKRAALEAAAEKIRNRQTTDNDNGIILDLMRKYGVDVPLRTQGWILDCLVCVTFDGDTVNYRYYKRKNGRGSQKVFDCIRDLVKAIDEEVA